MAIKSKKKSLDSVPNWYTGVFELQILFITFRRAWTCVAWIYEAFHVSSPGAAREREIMLFSACV